MGVRDEVSRQEGLADVYSTALALGFAGPASAAEPDGGPTVSSEKNSQIDIAQASVDLTTDSTSFDYADAVRAGVTTENTARFASGFQGMGGSILNGPSVLPALSDEITTSVTTLASCGGRNAYGTYLWGMQVAMNSCVTNVVLGAIGTAGGAVVVAGALSWIGAVPAALITGLMARPAARWARPKQPVES